MQRWDRSVRHESDVREIRQPAKVLKLPSPSPPYASVITPALVAGMALDHAMASEHGLACHAAEDALLLVECLAESRSKDDRATAAHAALTTGRAFLLLHEALRAKACLELATQLFDDAGDLVNAARARVVLADALLRRGEPAARAVLEDAGELFEQLGDERSAHAIDVALRRAEADIEESPRSFHAGAAPGFRT